MTDNDMWKRPQSGGVVYDYPAYGSQWTSPPGAVIEAFPTAQTRSAEREDDVPEPTTRSWSWPRILGVLILIMIAIGAILGTLMIIYFGPPQGAPSSIAVSAPKDADRAYLAAVGAIPDLQITDPAAVTRHGHEICAELASDTPEHVTVTEQRAYPGTPADQNDAIVHAAMTVYCPQYLKR
jgi:hypothetical protein